MKNVYRLLALFILLQSCTPLLIGVGGVAVGTTLVQEKSVGSSIDDTTIWTEINSSLIKNKQFFNIKVKVNEGRVLLTGIVPDMESTLEAVKIAWSYKGTKEVINEILIQEESESVLKSLWITTQIKSKLLFGSHIKSFNYTIVTMDDIVYLFGIAQNNNELNKVIKIAGTVSGVEKVISHVRLKTSRLRTP